MRCRVAVPFALIALASSAGVRAQTVTVRPDQRFQTIDGFGAFGPERVWWDPPPHHDASFLDTIVDDLGVSIVRTQIYWDGEATNDDADPNHFEWSRFDFGPSSNNGKQFPYIRDLRDRGVKVIASVWSPPIWMKQDPDDSLAVFCRGQCGGRLDPARRDEFAEYLAAYALSMRQHTGAEPYAISIQNEPLFANPFESCVYDADAYAATLTAVGDKLEQEGLTTLLFGPEHMGDYDWNESSGLLSALLDDPTPRRHLDIFAVHGYLDGFGANLGSARGWARFARRTSAAGVALWMTETSDLSTEGWQRAWKMARGLHLALVHGNAGAWVHWTFDRIVEDGQLNRVGQAFRAWFSPVRPGHVRIGAESTDPALAVSAFAGGAALTVVVLNAGPSAVDARIAVEGRPLPRFEVTRVDAAGTARLGKLDGDRVMLPAESITTLAFRGPADASALPGSSGAPSGDSGGHAAAAGQGGGSADGVATGLDRPGKVGGSRCRSVDLTPGWILAGIGAALVLALRRWNARSPGASGSDRVP